jgi:hypothetical protein
MVFVLGAGVAVLNFILTRWIRFQEENEDINSEEKVSIGG